MLAAVGIGFADDALVLTALAGFLVLAFQLGIGTRLAGLRDPRGLGQGALLPLSIAIGVVAGGMALQQVTCRRGQLERGGTGRRCHTDGQSLCGTRRTGMVSLAGLFVWSGRAQITGMPGVTDESGHGGRGGRRGYMSVCTRCIGTSRAVCQARPKRSPLWPVLRVGRGKPRAWANRVHEDSGLTQA